RTSFHCTALPTSHTTTLSLHDALPISFPEDGSMKITSMARTGNAPSRKRKAVNSRRRVMIVYLQKFSAIRLQFVQALLQILSRRSEEHTSELQSRGHLVCRLLLEKKKK